MGARLPPGAPRFKPGTAAPALRLVPAPRAFGAARQRGGEAVQAHPRQALLDQPVGRVALKTSRGSRGNAQRTNAKPSAGSLGEGQIPACTQAKAKQLLDRNTVEDNAVQMRLAECLIQRQDAAVVNPVPLRPAIPEQARVLSFTPGRWTPDGPTPPGACRGLRPCGPVAPEPAARETSGSGDRLHSPACDR